MSERRGIGLVEVIVVIIVGIFLFMLVIPYSQIHRKSASRVVCGTNLKGLGTAMTFYSNDYDDKYPQLPGEGPWSRNLGFAYYEDADFEGKHRRMSRSVSASMYLLVREADVSPKSFICPYDGFNNERIEFDGTNSRGKDLVELWDFGDNPETHVSYSYQLPYSEHAATGAASASFAVMGDMSPWFKDGDIVKPTEKTIEGWETEVALLVDHWTTSNDTTKYDIFRANSTNYINYSDRGQNVVFGDGHSAYEKYSDVGVKHDNIYTYQGNSGDLDKDIRIGVNPTSRDGKNKPANGNDSFLVF